MSRKLARESAMKLLYQMDIKNEYSNEEINHFITSNKFNDDEKKYILGAADYLTENVKEIDDIISKHAHAWKIDRLAKVDLAILRIAVYEIITRDDIPLKVSINEALEISKKYSAQESSKFINGILGSIVKECCKDE